MVCSRAYAELFADQLSAGENGNVFQNRFAAIAKARGFDSADFQPGAQAIDDERSQGFAFDIFSDDQKGFAAFCDSLQEGNEFFDGRDFLFVDQDVGIFEDAFLGFWVCHEVGREIAAVKVHAFNDFERRLEAFGFFHSNGAIFAYAFHRIRDDFGRSLRRYLQRSWRLARFLACL